MSPFTVGLVFGAKTLVYLAAFGTVLYFSVRHYRERSDGSAFLLFGCILLIAGYGVGLTLFTFGYTSMFLSALLEAFGAAAAAYGFTRIARSCLKSEARK
jgi:hypothetical protein